MRRLHCTHAFALLVTLSALGAGACDVSSNAAEPAPVGVGRALSSSPDEKLPDHPEFRVVDLAMPDTEYCQPLRDWDAQDIEWEREVLSRINALREQGLECGEAGSFEAAAPLKLNSALTCAARGHSRYMFENEVFDHLGPDGQSPGDRIALTGYPVTAWGENIAFGFATPEAVVEGWRNSDGHCANLMRPYYTQMGVGLVRGGSLSFHWTQVLATGEDLPPELENPAAPAPALGGMGAFLLCLGLGRAVFGARRSPEAKALV